MQNHENLKLWGGVAKHTHTFNFSAHFLIFTSITHTIHKKWGWCGGEGGLLLDNLQFYVYLRKIIAAKNSGGGAAYHFFRLYILLYFDF